MSASSDLEPGSVLAGQFRIRAKLAEGGMGAMYLAEQLVVDRLLAIQGVHQTVAGRDPETHERFKREARALAQIRHPNVVQLYTFGLTDDGSPFFAMEYVAGTTLEATLAHGRLQLPRTLAIAEQIASALAEAH